MVIPAAAPAVVSALVMRGSRTVDELADATGYDQHAVDEAVQWLRSHGFVESRRDRQTWWHSIAVHAPREKRRR